MNDKLNLEAEPFEFNPEFDETPELFDSEIFSEAWEGEVARKRRKPVRSPIFRARTVKAKQPSRSTFRPVKPPFLKFKPVKPLFPGLVIPPVVVQHPPYKPPDGTQPDNIPYGDKLATSDRTPYDSSAPAGVPPESGQPAQEGSEYVRWIQSSLNRILGLQLPLDGIMGTETRSAIRSFQEQRGIPVDGIVGPQTEKALIEASKGQTSEPSGTGDNQSSKTGEFRELGDISTENWLPEEKEFSFSGFPQSVLNALRSGLEGVAIKLAIVFGYRDENQLTNLVFFVRHPERFGREFVKGEPGYEQLVREWLNIRNSIIRPVLQGFTDTPSYTQPDETAFFKDLPRLSNVPEKPEISIEIDKAWPFIRRKLASTYNRVGGIIRALAQKVMIEVPAVLSVWFVESGGSVHVPGKAIIRFENHLFYRRWGKFNEELYNQHFRYGGHMGQPGKSWGNHKFRENVGEQFKNVHESQASEYRALSLAARLGGEDAALKSISIGGPQILISNYKVIGYSSPRKMYDAFQAGERAHVLGFFDFCNNTNTPRKGDLIKHLRERRWHDFARYYNGPGQVEKYGGHIQNAYNEALKLPIV